MKKNDAGQTDTKRRFARLTPVPTQGLTSEQVRIRMDAGAHNTVPQGTTPSIKRILLKNICTLFNLINLVLAVAIMLVGSPKNTLFFGIAICNTLMGIIQEVRAKRTLDKLSVLAKSRVTVIRDGQETSIDQEEVVLDDIVVLTTGNQICVDSDIVHSEGLEVNEALLTGEGDNIQKPVGAKVLSGSFVTAGRAMAQVTAVGAENYATALTVEARKEKKGTTPLMRTLNTIIRALTIAIVPVGALLFYFQYNGDNLQETVLGASSAVLGMIPEGLILLTGVTLTVGALRLATHKALVQSLPAIETLARVDVLCLDKTGTITDGTLSFEELIPVGGHEAQQAETAVRELMGALSDENATAKALRAELGEKALWRPDVRVPFSSARKWSGVSFEGKGSYVLGAPGFVFPDKGGDFFKTVNEYAEKGYRVLCLAHSAEKMNGRGDLPQKLECLALVVLSDTIRKEAKDTFRFFENEGVILKVISGDDPVTVSTIAAKAGIKGAERHVDMSALDKDTDYLSLVENYTVFGRVSPQQKRALIQALKHNGHTCCMTGDGVNDVLAMREASCSVAMVGGSDAARGACDFVLMSSDFSAMIEVLREGRRVINNIENVASMYLVKTIYSTILSVLYIFIQYPYPFAPIQQTPINTLTVGIPSFFLALRKNYNRPEGRFLLNILENALPAALTVVFNVLIVQLAGYCFDLTQVETSTMNVLLTGMVGFILLVRVAHPPTRQIKALTVTLIVAFLTALLFFSDIFELGSFLSRNAFFYLPLLYTSPKMFSFLSAFMSRLQNRAEATGALKEE